MSHIDELDEFEAQLELRLKREYSGVFELFRCCVLTQDATYLCNKLDLSYVAAAELPVLPPEDGGRLGLGQEPADPDDPERRDLHLERRHGRGAARRGRGAQADRRGARRADRRVAPAPTTSSSSSATCCSPSTSATPRRSSGLFDGERLAEHWRHRDRARAHRRRARRAARRAARPRRRRRDLPLLDGAGARPRVRALRRALGDGAAARRRARASRPGSRSGTTTRARSAPTGS